MKIFVILLSLLLSVPASALDLIIQRRAENPSPPAAGGCFANDTFTGADGVLTGHTSDSGHSWTVQGGSSGGWAISSNEAKDNTGTGPGQYSSATPPSADYYVQADSKRGSNDAGGVAMRMVTSADTSYRLHYSQASGYWRVRKVVSGTGTNLGTYVGDDPTTYKTIKLSFTGSNFVGYVSGVSRITGSDTAITAAGQAGLYGSGYTSDRLDNWSACQ